METRFSWRRHGWIAVVGAGAVGLAIFGSTLEWRPWAPTQAHGQTAKRDRLVDLADNLPASVQLADEDSAQTLGIKVAEVRPASSPEPMRLPGTLSVDPQR